MNNLIPKNVYKTKLEFWRGISIVEIIIIILWIGISTLFIISLPVNKIIKFIFCLILSLFVIPLLLPIMPGVKGWYALFLIFKFFSQTKIFNKHSKNSTSFLVPYDCVIENFIKTQKINNKYYYIAAFEIIGYNISYLKPELQEIRIQELQETLKAMEFPFSIMKMDIPISFDETINIYQQQLNKINQYIKQNNNIFYKSCKFGLTSYINNMNNKFSFLNENIKIKKTFYLFLYGKNLTELRERINTAKIKLLYSNFKIKDLSGYEFVNTIKLIFNPYQNKINYENYKKNKNQLEKILSFNNFFVTKNKFIVNDIYCSINSVYDYPIFPRYGWGASLAKNDQTIIWNINPLNSIWVKKALNKAINNSRTKMFLIKSSIDRSEQDHEIYAYEKLIEEIIGNNEVLKNVNILFLNYGLNIKRLKESENYLKKSLFELNMIINPLNYRQLEAYGSFIPTNNDNLLLENGREIPTSALASSFPFINSGLNDVGGLYLGDNTTGDIILFDQFKLTDKRKNHNKIIIGTSGSGKSYITKKEIIFHLNLGRTVIAIDPEREYQELCYFYDGQWIDSGVATFGRINPLQILDNSFKDQDDDNQYNFINNLQDKINFDEISEAPISIHLRLLDQWFKTLYSELSERERRILINQIKLTYQQFNIFNDTNISLLENNQFPIFDDLYNTIKESLYKNPNDILLNNLKELIYCDFINNGQYGQLWNGHTTLKINANFIVYDVWTLFDQDIPKVTSAQLYLILSFVKGEIKRNRFKKDNKIIIVIDEAHLAIDKDNPVALNFIYQMVKRIRKYKGGVIITTQNWNDFTGTEEIKKKTSAIINNTQYTMIMNLAPSDLNDLEEVYKSYGGLSEDEKKFISQAGKGEMLFIVSGFERYCLKIKIFSEEEMAFKNDFTKIIIK